MSEDGPEGTTGAVGAETEMAEDDAVEDEADAEKDRWGRL